MDRCLFFREFIIIIRGVRYVSLCVCCFIVCVLLKVGGLKGGGLSGCWWTDALDSRGGVSGSGFLFLFVSHSAPEKWIFLSFLSPCDGAASSPRRRVSHAGALSPRDEGVRSPDESGERKTEPRPREA